MIVVYIFFFIIALMLIIATFLPKTYLIEKSIVVKADPQTVMTKVADLNYYKQWNPWQQMDPAAKSKITGVAQSIGHKYEWIGKNVGIGSLTLSFIDDKHLRFDLEFLKPWKSQAKDNWLFDAWGNNNETKITWQNSGNLPWPMARLMGGLISKNLNVQFEKGLNNLKQMFEE